MIMVGVLAAVSAIFTVSAGKFPVVVAPVILVGSGLVMLLGVYIESEAQN